MSDFKIHSILLVKDESDILAACIEHAIKWSDFIHILDNGSTDKSVDVIEDAVQRYQDRIFFYGVDRRPFTNSLRQTVFMQFRSLVCDGDWICRLDADEFYAEDPRFFLDALPYYISRVDSAMFQYYFTEKDLSCYEKDPCQYQAIDNPKHIYNYYRCDFSEPRFFRYRSSMIWQSTAAWPRFIGAVNKRNIALRHYKYRSLPQMQKRRHNRLRTAEGFSHVAIDSQYGLKIESSASCLCDREQLFLIGDKAFVFQKRTLRQLFSIFFNSIFLYRIIELMVSFFVRKT